VAAFHPLRTFVHDEHAFPLTGRPQGIVSPIHERVAPSRGHRINGLLCEVTANEADDLSHVHVVVLSQISALLLEYCYGHAAARVAAAFAQAAVHPFPTDPLARNRGQPITKLDRTHIHCSLKVSRDAFTAERQAQLRLTLTPSVSGSAIVLAPEQRNQLQQGRPSDDRINEPT